MFLCKSNWQQGHLMMVSLQFKINLTPVNTLLMHSNKDVEEHAYVGSVVDSVGGQPPT